MRPDLESLDGSHRLGRRSFLIATLATGAAVAVPVNYAAIACKRRIPLAKHGKFGAGVASGFPRPRGIELWTRVGEIKRSSKLRVLVATDRKFGNVVEEKLVTARRDRDFTARTFVRGLEPDKHYFYRFVTERSKSPIDRFTTAPPIGSRNGPSPTSGTWTWCSASATTSTSTPTGGACAGTPAATTTTATASCCASTGRGTASTNRTRTSSRCTPRTPSSRSGTTTRGRTTTPTGSRASPSRTRTPPSSSNYPRRVPFAQREANGQQAFFNYMPRARLKAERDRVSRSTGSGASSTSCSPTSGSTAKASPCNDEQLDPSGCPDSPRTMLGSRQLSSFLEKLTASPATWKLWGTELMVMPTRIGPGIPAQVDAWDGYGSERKAILDWTLDQGIQNVVAITGDIHTFFAGTAYTTGDESTAAGAA